MKFSRNLPISKSIQDILMSPSPEMLWFRSFKNLDRNFTRVSVRTLIYDLQKIKAIELVRLHNETGAVKCRILSQPKIDQMVQYYFEGGDNSLRNQANLFLDLFS